MTKFFTLNGRRTRSKDYASLLTRTIDSRKSFERYFLTSSRDMTARLFTLNPLEGFRPKTFAGHRDVVLNAYFSSDNRTVGVLFP